MKKMNGLPSVLHQCHPQQLLLLDLKATSLSNLIIMEVVMQNVAEKKNNLSLTIILQMPRWCL